MKLLSQDQISDSVRVTYTWESFWVELWGGTNPYLPESHNQRVFADSAKTTNLSQEQKKLKKAKYLL